MSERLAQARAAIGDEARAIYQSGGAGMTDALLCTRRSGKFAAELDLHAGLEPECSAGVLVGVRDGYSDVDDQATIGPGVGVDLARRSSSSGSPATGAAAMVAWISTPALCAASSGGLAVAAEALSRWRQSMGAASGGMTTSQRGGRNPASVTVTSRRTAALDGRPLAAVRACRQ